MCPHVCTDLFVGFFLVCLTKMSMINSPSMGHSAQFLSCLVHLPLEKTEKLGLGLGSLKDQKGISRV